MDDLIQVDPALLAKWNRPVPRYTSYPTAPQFHSVDESLLKERIGAFEKTEKPLSIYIHIPFCKSMCLFCGCSVILNRNPERQERYFHALLKEIALAPFKKKRTISQLHLGGGTPTELTIEELERLMQALRSRFHFAEKSEISIEIDPRTVYADKAIKLEALKRLGFNRVSFGVQDLDQNVQEAVKRRQSEEMTVETYLAARRLGFEGINIDLIYGLPHQTVRSYAATSTKLIELKPDRIAFYSYAKIPWLKAHQKAIPDASLPTTEEKFNIYVETRKAFMSAGYTAIGMDHFALASDPLSKAYREKKLTRNFQGYAVELAEDMIGFGVTSIGYMESCFFQNVKELEDYQTSLERGILPVFRGFILSPEDIRRRWIIQSLMCQFELDKKLYSEKFAEPLDFDLEELKEEGLIIETPEKILPTPLGRLFIRLIAARFDAYIMKGRFSKAV
jgi:oxygen-independent coproporphyrinogen-3 oxidase